MRLADLVTEKISYKIYCDMDGVLTDFSGDFLALTKKFKVALEEDDSVPDNAASRWEKKHGSEAFWEVVRLGGLKFWSDMSWETGGKKLWGYIKKHNPSILSAPSKRVYENCIKGKKVWCSRLSNPEIIFRSKEKKREFAKKNAILIDDLKSNIRDWKSAGGIAIHHTNVNKTIAELKELGL